jgi:hypothetical protein
MRISLLILLLASPLLAMFFHPIAFTAEERGAISVVLSKGTTMSREGSITLDGQSRRVVLVDQNRNGTFNDRFEITATTALDGRLVRRQCDSLYIQPVQSDRSFVDYGVGIETGQHYVSKVICLEGRFYALDVAPSGDRLTFTPWSSPTGYVANPNDRYIAVLYSEMGNVTIRGNSDDKHPLPVGEWKLLKYSLDRTARNRSGTVVSGRPSYVLADGTKESPVIKIREGKTALLPFGPPYKAMAKVQRSHAQGVGKSKYAMLGLEIRGTGGEVLTGFMVNGAKPKKPRLVITDRNGGVVEQGHFSFG